MNKLPLILLLCATYLVSGCDNVEGEGNSFEKKKQNAIDALKGDLEFYRKFRRSDNHKSIVFAEYAETKLAKALEYLNSLSGPKYFKEPYPYLANFTFEVRTRSNQILYRPHFCVHWLEKGMAISEIFIEDEKGNTYKFPSFNKAREAYNTYYKDTLYRMDGIMICVSGGRAPEKLDYPTKVSVNAPVLSIPIEAFCGKIKFGLITTNGKRTPAIEAFVVPGFYEESKPQ